MSDYTICLLGLKNCLMTIYGHPPATGSIADWMLKSVPGSEGRS